MNELHLKYEYIINTSQIHYFIVQIHLVRVYHRLCGYSESKQFKLMIILSYNYLKNIQQTNVGKLTFS